MLQILRHILKGSRYHPTVGSHPGTPILIFFCLLGSIAATSDEFSWLRALLGALGMLIVFGPIWLVGAYERSLYVEGLNNKK
jgi:hypothetical protein